MKEAENKMAKAILILGLMVVFSISGFGQNQIGPLQFDKIDFVKKKYDFETKNMQFLPRHTFRESDDFSINPKYLYQFDNLALFCKFEERVAQNSKIAMRFRLGSLDYVDLLENKPYTTTKK